MALSYSSAIQNQIAYGLANVPYASLKTSEKAAIDGTWSSGTVSSASHAGQALSLLATYANFVDDSGTTEIPDAWVEWLVWQVVHSAAIAIRPEIARESKARMIEARRDAFGAYNRQGWHAATGTEQWVITLAGIRLFIVSACVRLRPSLLPEPSVTDALIRRTLHRIWHARDWPWLRYSETCTIPSATGNTTPTVTYASGNTPGKLLTRRPRYIGTTDNDGFIQPVNAERMSYEQSRGLDDGRPDYFCLRRDNDGALVWEFERGTDQAYTFRAEFLKVMPDITSSSGFNTIINQMPPQERDLAREISYAETLRAYGRNVGESIEGMIDRAIGDNDTIAKTGDHDDVSVETYERQLVDEMRLGSPFGMLGGNV